MASSIVDLWKDLSTEEARVDFLKYHKGWIGHTVLHSSLEGNGAASIERVIEVSCCLDLLCQEHRVAVAIVNALRTPAISRLAAWDGVQGGLKSKLIEIAEGHLAHDVHPAAVFRAPRDISMEYWILSRAYRNYDELLVESLFVQPQEQEVRDVESRITNLEALVFTLDETNRNAENQINNSKQEVTGALSGLEDTTDTDVEVSSVDSLGNEDRVIPEVEPLQRMAAQTRDRISRGLEELKRKIHQKAGNNSIHGLNVEGFDALEPVSSSHSSLNPFDHRSMLRLNLQNDLKTNRSRSRANRMEWERQMAHANRFTDSNLLSP